MTINSLWLFQFILTDFDISKQILFSVFFVFFSTWIQGKITESKEDEIIKYLVEMYLQGEIYVRTHFPVNLVIIVTIWNYAIGVF